MYVAGSCTMFSASLNNNNKIYIVLLLTFAKKNHMLVNFMDSKDKQVDDFLEKTNKV